MLQRVQGFDLECIFSYYAGHPAGLCPYPVRIYNTTKTPLQLDTASGKLVMVGNMSFRENCFPFRAGSSMRQTEAVIPAIGWQGGIHFCSIHTQVLLLLSDTRDQKKKRGRTQKRKCGEKNADYRRPIVGSVKGG